jgi:hypothetical protein
MDVRRDSRGAVPHGVIGMIALVVAVEALLYRNEILFSTEYTLDWGLQGEAAGRPGRGGVLCFGDSLVKCGVIPQVLERRLGRPASNLAVMGGLSATSYVLLRRALDSGARPEAIVIDFQPSLLTQPLRSNTRNWPSLLTLRETWELCREARDSELLGNLVLVRPLRSLRARYEIRASVMEALRAAPEPRTMTFPGMATALLRHWALNKGAMIMAPDATRRAQATSSHQEHGPTDWRSDRAGGEYVLKFLRLATARGIPTFWLIPPFCPGAQAGRDESGADEAFTRFVRRVQAKVPGVVVLDGRHSGYGDDQFVDAVHLNRHGAASLSVALAEVLRPYLSGVAGPRWSSLPASRALDPLALSAEDLSQSRERVRAGVVRR